MLIPYVYCVSEDMSPYCSAHDEWLIMKLCMYVGYHDATNVSNFGSDPVTQLHLKTVLNYYSPCFTDMAFHSRYAVSFCGGCYAITSKLQQYGGQYPPKHSPSLALCPNVTNHLPLKICKEVQFAIPSHLGSLITNDMALPLVTLHDLTRLPPKEHLRWR